MIEKLLPPSVVSVEQFGDVPNPCLYPEEERAVAAAVPARRREYATVRVCARAALARLGAETGPILSGARGAPTWPDGVVGSMTHCPGYRAAVVARSSGVVAVGVDAERHEPLCEPGVVEMVTVPAERAWLRVFSVRRPEVHWERLLFSVKESVYKAWFPLTGQWLDFDDVAVTVDPVAGTFHARLLVPGPVVEGARLFGFSGRWLVEAGLVLTAVAVVRDPVKSMSPAGASSEVSTRYHAPL